jgi:aminopeptidase N
MMFAPRRLPARSDDPPGAAGEVGDGPFFEILRTWAAEHRYGTATTQEFIALSEEISGLDLSNFFQVWLYTPETPKKW